MYIYIYICVYIYIYIFIHHIYVYLCLYIYIDKQEKLTVVLPDFYWGWYTFMMCTCKTYSGPHPQSKLNQTESDHELTGTPPGADQVLSHAKCFQSRFAKVNSHTNPSTYSLC